MISPFTQGQFRDPNSTSNSSTAEYAQIKRTKLNTAQRCLDQGILFEPIVFEGSGGVELGAKKVLEGLFRTVAGRTDSSPQEVLERVLGRISIDFQRAWHRSLTRRRKTVLQDESRSSTGPVEYYRSWAPGG